MLECERLPEAVRNLLDYSALKTLAEKEPSE
jgi:hypothetical protein